MNIAELQKDMVISLDGQPWAVVSIQFVNPGKGAAFYRLKLKGLKTGNTIEKTFKSGEQFEEANFEKIRAKFIYSHRDKFFFSEENNSSNRFELSKEVIGSAATFLKQNEVVDGILIDGKIINITLPIKVHLKVTESPPGLKGDRAQGGTKAVIVETGAQINVPLFIEEGDIVEINTETGEYVRRVE